MPGKVKSSARQLNGYSPITSSPREWHGTQVLEETGIVLDPKRITFAYATTDVFPELGKQYVTVSGAWVLLGNCRSCGNTQVWAFRYAGAVHGRALL